MGVEANVGGDTTLLLKNLRAHKFLYMMHVSTKFPMPQEYFSEDQSNSYWNHLLKMREMKFGIMVEGLLKVPETKEVKVRIIVEQG